MVTSFLGIVKASGAYVSFDPTYPQDHLDYRISDSPMPMLVAQQRLAAAFESMPEDWAVPKITGEE